MDNYSGGQADGRFASSAAGVVGSAGRLLARSTADRRRPADQNDGIPILHGNPYGPALTDGQPNCQAGQTGYAARRGPAARPGRKDNPAFGVSQNVGPGRSGVPPLGKTDLFLTQNGDRDLLGLASDPPMNPRRSSNRRLSNFQIGLIAIVLTFIGFYLAFTKSIPFAGHGYQLKAVFADAQNIRAKSPVRISGVEVGEVTDVQHVTDANGNGEDAAVVTMDIKDSALPIRQDATHAAAAAPLPRGQPVRRPAPGQPGRARAHSGSVVPREPDLRARSSSTRSSPRSRRRCGRTCRSS